MILDADQYVVLLLIEHLGPGTNWKAIHLPILKRFDINDCTVATSSTLHALVHIDIRRLFSTFPLTFGIRGLYLRETGGQIDPHTPTAPTTASSRSLSSP